MPTTTGSAPPGPASVRFAQRPDRNLFAGLSAPRAVALGLCILAVGAALTLAGPTAGLIAAVGVSPLAGAALLMLEGRALIEWAPVAAHYVWRGCCGQLLFLAQIMSARPRPAGTLPLPGDVTRLRVLQSQDGSAIIHDPYTDCFTAVAAVHGEAFLTADPGDQDAVTAGWGRALAGIAADGQIRRIQILHTTRPDTGATLKATATQGISQSCSETATVAYLELLDQTGPWWRHDTLLAITLTGKAAHAAIRRAAHHTGNIRGADRVLTAHRDAIPDTLAAAAQRRAQTPDDPRAVALLVRAGDAAQALAYEGRLVTRTTALRPLTETRVTAIPGLGTVVAGEGGALVLAGQGRSTSLADATAVLGLLADNYQVLRATAYDQDIAARPAEAVDARRADGTLAARFWVDRATGLLLRRDLLARSGATTISTWFAVLRVGPTRMLHLPPMAADPWSHRLDAHAQQEWRDAGCSCEPVLPDGMTLLQARTDDDGLRAGPGHGVVHLLYSDGLAEMSLFDQPGHLGADAVAALTAQGFAPVTYAGVEIYERMTRPSRSVSPVGTGEWVWQSGTSVLTLVGAATPRAAVLDRTEQVVAALAALPCHAVGARTAQAALAAGFLSVDEGPGTAEALADALAGSLSGQSVVYLCGRVRLPAFEARLSSAGVDVRAVETYDTIGIDYADAAVIERLSGWPVDLALVYSARAGAAIRQLAERPALRGLFDKTRFLALSDRVAATLGNAGGKDIRVAARPDEDALLALLRG